ncbi:hypothetical protein [Ornithinimicrobium faecis]|uniref:hypothetical protein n=1 Tax=Ornithinimicrobium faecis TaxID=2934158 RepID=UPI002118B7A0|nr:hypothetical protein [Ornithinimicrobium sp. HY1745]
MRTQHAVRGGQRRGGRRVALATLPVAALVLMTACGSEEEPEVQAPPTSADEPTDSESTTEPAEETDNVTTNDDDAPVTADPQPTAVDPAPTTEEPTTEEPTTEAPTTEEPTTEEPPEEGAGDAEAFAQEYIDLVASGDAAGAYGMLSPEAMVYYPDQTVFEENGIADFSEDLANAGDEPSFHIRPAYEETHDSAQVVSLLGFDEASGEPWAHTFAIRKLDGASWVVDQEITPSTGQNRLNWLNPGIQEGVSEWQVNPDQPMSFALLKNGGPNTAVTASINDGDGVPLTERPTDGAVMYDLTDAELTEGYSIIAASWVAEDAPFVHTSATPAG